jgi:hypothetical protein
LSRVPLTDTSGSTVANNRLKSTGANRDFGLAQIAIDTWKGQQVIVGGYVLSVLAQSVWKMKRGGRLLPEAEEFGISPIIRWRTVPDQGWSNWKKSFEEKNQQNSMFRAEWHEIRGEAYVMVGLVRTAWEADGLGNPGNKESQTVGREAKEEPTC